MEVRTEVRASRKELRRKIIALTAPIVVQNLLSAAVSSADVIMLNYVSQSAISAVSLCAQFTNVLYMLYYGLGTGATMLCAQYYGKGELQPIRIVEGISLRISLVVSALMAVLVLTCPKLLMTIFTNDAELIELGASYLRIMSVTYLCWGVLEVYLAILRSIGKVRISMFLNMMAFGLNILLNAVFIFGLFGAPRLGVVGVALATMISRVIELIGCFIVSAHEKEIKLKLSYMRLHNKLLMQDFLQKAAPALINDIAWGLAFSMYSAVLGHISNDMLAANSIVTVVRNIGTTFCFAVASGGSIALGNLLGAGRLEEGEQCAKEIMKLTVIAGAVGGVIVLCASPFVLAFADLTETALGYLRIMLYINSYYIMGAAVNTSMIAGIFRAGGDSRFGMVCDIVTMWCYALPVTAICAFVIQLPPMWVYFIMCTDEFVKWPAVLHKYHTRSWLRNITRDNLADA